MAGDWDVRGLVESERWLSRNPERISEWGDDREEKKRCNISIKELNSKDFQKKNLGGLKCLHNKIYEVWDRKK